MSDERISSPVLNTYDVVVVLNQQSLDKFESKVKPGGILMYDTYGIHKKPTRTDIKIYPIDATEKSIEMKNSKTFNMIVLKKTLPERHWHLIPLNEEALKEGGNLIKE